MGTRVVLRVLVLVSSVCALAACKRSVCDVSVVGLDPISPTWQAHKDWVPPSATVCGHLKGLPQAEDSLQIDFENDPNPWVTIVDYLEAKGLKRRRQSIDNPERQSVTFATGDATFPTLNVDTIREKGRVRAILELQKPF